MGAFWRSLRHFRRNVRNAWKPVRKPLGRGLGLAFRAKPFDAMWPLFVGLVRLSLFTAQLLWFSVAEIRRRYP